jgi:hypothetical protein
MSIFRRYKWTLSLVLLTLASVPATVYLHQPVWLIPAFVWANVFALIIGRRRG